MLRLLKKKNLESGKSFKEWECRELFLKSKDGVKESHVATRVAMHASYFALKFTCWNNYLSTGFQILQQT